MSKDKKPIKKEDSKKKFELKLETILPKDEKRLEDFVKIGKSKARKDAIIDIEFEKYVKKDVEEELNEDETVDSVISQFKEDEQKAKATYGKSDSKNTEYESAQNPYQQENISDDGFGYDRKEDPEEKNKGYQEGGWGEGNDYGKHTREEYFSKSKQDQKDKEEKRKKRGY